MKNKKTKRPEVVYRTIMQIEAYKPGTSAIKGVVDPVKLSSNENPFGTSPKALKAMQKAALKAHRYPEGSSLKLRKAIAKHYNIDADRIVCGDGSDELLGLLAQAYAKEGDEVIYSEFGFLMYPISALRVGAKPVMAKEKNLCTSIDNILKKVTRKTKIVFLANPNNPTGSYITKKEMRHLRSKLPAHVLLVIDSAYGEYVMKEDYSTGLGMVDEWDNVVTTRTFSKIFGLGGVRLGWAYCPAHIADVLNRVRGPFNVSNIAQSAGIAALEDKKFYERSRLHNAKWLELVSKGITKAGFKVYPSVANFILVDFGSDKKAKAVDRFLKSKRIIGRMMKAYGLPTCMRFTIGLEKENRALLAALAEFSRKKN